MIPSTLATTRAHFPSNFLCYGCLGLFFCLCAYLYSKGLTGPLMLDDFKIIIPLMNIRIPLENIEFIHNNDFLFGRGVALLSFIVDINNNPNNPVYQLKLSNLLLHLAVGISLFLLLIQWIKRTALHSQALIIATLVTGIWLLHSINTSTVLYTVQRMAQLSCLFTLLCLLGYSYARRAMSANTTHWYQGHNGKSLSLLAISGLIFFPLALFSKESAVLIPVFVLAVERCLFRSHGIAFSGFITRLGMGYLTVLIIALIYLSYTAPSSPADLSPLERLATQSRVVNDYLFQFIMPFGINSGLYFDNYAPSYSLIDPWATLINTAVHVLLMGAMVYCLKHRTLTLVGLGIFLFYSGHLLESTLLPLELYFEHRNYLAIMGLTLALVTLVVYAGQKSRNTRIISYGLLTLFFGLNLLALDRKITLWSDYTTMVTTGYINQPLSIRAKVHYAQLLTDNSAPSKALNVLDEAMNTPYHKKHSQLTLQKLFVHCRFAIPASDAVYQQLEHHFFTTELTIELSTAINNLLTTYQQHGCSEHININRLFHLLSERRTSPTLSHEHRWSLTYYLSFIKAEINQDIARASDILLTQLKQGEIRAGYYLLDIYQRLATPSDPPLKNTLLNALKESSSLSPAEKSQLINGLNKLSAR